MLLIDRHSESKMNILPEHTKLKNAGSQTLSQFKFETVFAEDISHSTRTYLTSCTNLVEIVPSSITVLASVILCPSSIFVLHALTCFHHFLQHDSVYEGETLLQQMQVFCSYAVLAVLIRPVLVDPSSGLALIENLNNLGHNLW